MSKQMIDCKYDLSPMVEPLRFEAPDEIAETLDRLMSDYAIRVLLDDENCGPYESEANGLMTLRDLRDAFRQMTVKEE